jgi:hypothetical protein
MSFKVNVEPVENRSWDDGVYLGDQEAGIWGSWWRRLCRVIALAPDLSGIDRWEGTQRETRCQVVWTSNGGHGRG